MPDLSAAMTKIVAANIQTLRQRLGYRQDEFADEIGASQGSISRWESGAVEPNFESLQRLADLSGVSLKEFRTQLIPKRAPAMRGTPGLRLGNAILMAVQLPSEDALRAMFEALLEPWADRIDRDEVARSLAHTLPDALAQTVAHQHGRHDTRDSTQSHSEVVQSEAKGGPVQR